MENNTIQNNEQQLTKKERKELRREERHEEQRRMKTGRSIKRFINWFIVFAIIGGGAYGIVRFSNNSAQEGALLTNTVSEDDWAKGAQNAQVIFVEYGDFQCPACGAYYPLVKQLSVEFEDSVQFVYRHFPLRGIHPNADIAARASEAAGNQGKFWEMHDMIFENQSNWSNVDAREMFVGYAEALALDLERFNNDLDSLGVADRVQEDLDGGTSSGVNSTPTFFVNGEKIRNPQNYADFQNVINLAIQNNQQSSDEPQLTDEPQPTTVEPEPDDTTE